MSEEEYTSETWIHWFCSMRENQFMCEVDPAYIEDQFNLYGLRSFIPHFRDCLDMILDCGSDSDPEPEEWSGNLYTNARDLYGLIHARFILTNKGMNLMAAKFAQCHFGVCPRVFCKKTPVLPVGLRDEIGHEKVKVYCPSCQDVFRPTDTGASESDGAYYGTTFPHLFLMVKPTLVPAESKAVYVPRIYGFKLFHPSHLKTKQSRARLAAAEKAERGAGAGAGAAAGRAEGSVVKATARGGDDAVADGSKKRKSRP